MIQAFDMLINGNTDEIQRLKLWNYIYPETTQAFGYNTVDPIKNQ